MILSEAESREIKIGVAVAVLGAFIVSLTGGALGVYVGYRLLEQRMTAVEAATSSNRESIDSLKRVYDDRLSVIAENVAYIRGKMENK